MAVLALRIMCMLSHAAAFQHNSDPNGIFYTRPVPNKFDSLESRHSADLLRNGNNHTARVYLVAGTRDGGPFSNVYFPEHNVSRSGMCEVRNFHEEVGVRQCMHWQVEDHYDADWFHACLEPNEFWVDSNEDALTNTPSNASLLSTNANLRKSEASVAQQQIYGHSPQHWIKEVWTGTCEGFTVVLNLLDLFDSKGLEVAWQGGSNFPETCMEQVKNIVKQAGLASWNLERCNIDPNRKTEDFPWPTGPST